MAAVTTQNDATTMASLRMFPSPWAVLLTREKAARPPASLVRQGPVRARFVDDLRQELRQRGQHIVHRQAELAREFLDLGIAENGLELIGGDRHVLAVAQPRLDLRAEAALLQRRHQAGQVVILR